MITETYVNPANVQDIIPCHKRLDTQREFFEFVTHAVGLAACQNVMIAGSAGQKGGQRNEMRARIQD